ncbi:hypothetical protein ACFVU3_31985 [Streptomyces sp. NPDC058052]|uniref:hypothetical protein n=1 Tax=Streptomyces sp. NPDC058052 TaxID=3346316 RepID=UPI0036E4BBA5
MLRLPWRLSAPCTDSGTPSMGTTKDFLVVVIVIVIAALLLLAGLPGLSVFIVLAEAVSFGYRLARRLRTVKLVPAS